MTVIGGGMNDDKVNAGINMNPYSIITDSIGLASDIGFGIYDRYKAEEQYKDEQKRLDEQAKLEEEWRKKNFALEQSAFNYQKELNQKQMEREDTQFSRAMADYKRAGLSGLAAIGSSAGAGSMTSLPAPQMDTSGSRDVMRESVRSSQANTKNRSERITNMIANRINFNNLRLERTNQILQSLKLDNEIESEKINREKLKAETKAIKNRDEWESKNGYRNQDWESKLIAVLDNYLSSGKPQQIAEKMSKEKKDIVQALNETKTEFKEGMAHDINQILNKGDYSNQPNNLPDKYMFSPMTYSRIDQLQRNWSPDLARKTYYNSSILRSCFTEEAWLNYYSKNTTFLKGIFKHRY